MTTPDRRLCPHCQRMIATREQATTGRLVLRDHGGTVVRAKHATFGPRGTINAVSGGCEGSEMQVDRLTQVWRATGAGRGTAGSPVCVYRSNAEGYARGLVRDAGLASAAVQRFDIATQQWVTVAIIDRGA